MSEYIRDHNVTNERGEVIPLASKTTDDGIRVPLTAPANITGKFREAFEQWDPVGGNRWRQVVGSGDIVMLDGNTAAASYLVISKDPLTAATETVVETVGTFLMPFDIAVGLSLSQRTLGQEFSIEAVSIDQSAPLDDLAIASISQTATTLTVTTSQPHNLSPGRRIGIKDVSDSRLNYPSLVVASIPNATTFTCTAGPMGNIPSITSAVFNSGSVYYRSALGYADNGINIMFEQASATNASIFVRSEAGDVLPSGNVAGSHSVTVGSTAPGMLVTTPNAYAFQPTTEYRLSVMADKCQVTDVPVDSINSATSRSTRSQVVPDPASRYKFRIRATNNKAYTVPTAKVVSAAKAGNSTATVTTETPHGLTVNDFVLMWGQRDQTNFTATGTPVQVASIVSPTQFTVAYGASATATTFGGFVARSNGGTTALGYISQSVQSVAITSGILSVVGSANWSGLSIGDTLNLYGVRDNTAGADMGLDGVYRVRNVSSSNLELEPLNISIPANLALVNAGGAVIKRTDLRVSYVRIFDFERHRVELAPRPFGDNSSSVPVVVQNNQAMSGSVAPDSNVPNPVHIGGRGSNVNPSALGATGRLQHLLMTMIGAAIAKPYCIPEAEWGNSLALTTTADTLVRSSGGAGIRQHITYFWAINTGASMVELILKDNTTERERYPLPPNVPVAVEFPTGIVTTSNSPINAALSAAGTVRLNIRGYTAP